MRHSWGPGTVLTSAAAGAGFGYTLGWVLVFSAVAVFVLQSFTAASGILAGQGLAEALRTASNHPAARLAIFSLVVVGLWVGCAAFETGNLLGAGAGLDIAFGLDRWLSLVIIAAVAVLVLLFDLKAITNLLAVLVAAMSVLFVTSAVLADVDIGALLPGLLVPRIPEGSILTVIALMGTTIVTYNLFLHASATKSYWSDTDHRVAWRRELVGMAIFVPLGGLVSLAILATGAATADGEIPSSIAEFTSLLEPAAGGASRFLFAGGLVAAGLTSAVTAPLAASAGIAELFAWDKRRDRTKIRVVWLSVVATGLLFGLTDVSPLKLIVAAQAANGVLLPLIAGTVVYLAVRQSAARLPHWYLALGGVIVLVCAALGFRTLYWVWGQI